MSFVVRFIIPYPYLGVSAIQSSTVIVGISLPCSGKFLHAQFSQIYPMKAVSWFNMAILG